MLKMIALALVLTAPLFGAPPCHASTNVIHHQTAETPIQAD